MNSLIKASKIAVGSLLVSLVQAAPHPTVIFTKVDDAVRPLVRVIGTDPVVEENGKQQRMHGEPFFFAERAPIYAEPTVEIKRLTLSGMALKAMANQGDDPKTAGGFLGGTSFIEATLVASTELREAYMAIVVFDQAFLDGSVDQPATQIVIHELPKLPAGVETRIDFTAALYSSMTTRKSFFPLIFVNGGAEARTNFWPHAERYFGRVEKIKLARAIDDYRSRFAGADHAAAPFIIVRPILPPGPKEPGFPTAVTLEVSEAGWVTKTRFEPDGPNAYHAALADTFGSWLFLPRLKAGQPVSSSVVVPLKF